MLLWMKDGEGQDRRESKSVIVVWTCPLCGASEGKLTQGGLSSGRAVGYLMQHIRQTDGADHGPLHQLPDGAVLETPEDWIKEIEYPPE